MNGYKFYRASALVVDDKRYMSDLLAEMLSAIGFGYVCQAADGDSARDLLRNRQTRAIDIVICDLNMRPVNGAALLRWVRHDLESPNRFLPMIMLTGHTEFDKIVTLRDLGATEIMAKPITVKTLTNRLIGAIDRPRRFVDTPNYFGPDRRRQQQPFPGEDRRQWNPSDPV